MASSQFWVVTFAAVFSFTANATEGSGKKPPSHETSECVHALTNASVRVVASGREGPDLALYNESNQFLFAPGGLLDRFGIPLRGQVIAQIVKGTEMDELASSGGPPVSHWTAGQDIFNMLQGRGLVYEFVAPTCNHRHAFYRDTLDFPKQISIINHVAGHYVFGIYSRFPQVRMVDGPQESIRLYQLLESAYQQYGHDEVSAFYQQLQSIKMAQDMSRGTFSTPDLIKEQKHTVPTASVLQAFVSNLPSNIAPWKAEIARQFERTHRFYSGAAPTKIMNEGFASLMQELLPAHMPQFRDFKHALEFADLMDGVARPDLGNPYWLGREAWRRLRSRFNARKEIAGLSRFEQDKAFLKYATQEIISGYDDFDFIRLALDAHWVRETGLAFVRKATNEDISGRQPPQPPAHLQAPELKVVASRDAKKIVHSIARHVADLQSKLPRVVHLSADHKGIGEILLGFDDPYGSYFPLERFSMVETLLVMSRVLSKPIHLATQAMPNWPGMTPPTLQPSAAGAQPALGWPRPGFEEPAPLRPIPIGVRVEPSGEVQVSRTSATGETIRVPELEKEFEDTLKVFLVDLSLSENPRMQSAQQQIYQRVLSHLGEEMADQLSALPPLSLFSHSPTASRAIAEYLTLVRRRLGPALQAAIQGTGPLFFGKSGVSISVLPTIPSLNFDHRAMSQLKAQSSALQRSLRSPKGLYLPARALVLDAAGAPIEPDDAFDLDTPPGDIYWGEGNPEGQGGEGEPGEEEGDPARPGQGGKFLTVPLELYAKALQESVKLPRMRPKDGPSKMKESTRQGYDSRRNGTMAPAHIAKNALKLGMALKAIEGVQEPEPDEALLEGYKRLRRQDWVVRDSDENPTPDFNAMVLFMVDMSGSMLMEDRLKVAKRMAHDLRALLSARYKQITFRFIAFDGESHVFDDANKFFSAQLGGGTDYAKGFERGLQVQEQFPRSKWDRFSVTLGDMDDFADPSQPMGFLEKLATQSEFTGLVGLGSGSDTTGLAKAMQGLAAKDPFVSFQALLKPQTYAPAFFRKLFKNEDEK